MIGNWVRANIGCYFGNAAAVRDFRVQLRGNRAILLWGFYLMVLIGFTMIVYSGSSQGYQTSIVDAQRRLREFYQSIMILLAVMINLISPALTAGSIVMERQRRSLDLVFSAPVTPKYYLVGKMVSSYRYVWMLLILSLPVTSACVVLGGATWSDVIAAYVILSFNALIYTAMALLLSTLSRQPVAAVVWSYFAAITYSILTASIAGSAAAMGAIGLSRTLEAPFSVTLNPYFVVQAAPTFTKVYGYDIPNWVLGAVFAILFSKIMLLAAGSAMSGLGAKETKSLRIHGIVYAFLGSALVAYSMTPMVGMVRSSIVGRPPGTPGLSSGWQSTFDLMFGWILIPLVVLIPFLACYGSDAERRYWSDGVLRIKNAIIGTPSGGLPYIVFVVLATFFGIGLVYQQVGLAMPSMAILFWSLSFWAFMWSLGRLSSSFNFGLRGARSLHFTLMMALVALPVPFFSAMGSFSSSNAGIWDLYILRPLIGSDDNRSVAWVYGILMLAATLIITFIAETNAARKGVLQRYAT
jgi:ABC-type transport system involved in multi-copper enzyme maturation permease subunit